MSSLRNFYVAAAVVGLVGAGAALRSGAAPAHATPSVLTDNAIPDVAERVVDSVVNIGRASVPPRIVSVVMVLQRLEGLSDV